MVDRLFVSTGGASCGRGFGGSYATVTSQPVGESVERVDQRSEQVLVLVASRGNQIVVRGTVAAFGG